MAASGRRGDRARDVRHGRRGRRRRRRDFCPEIPSSCVRSTRARRRRPTAGFSHIGRRLRFIGIDAPGALQASWTVPAFTLHALPAGLDLRLAALAEPLAVACHDVRRGEVAAGETAVVIGGGPIGTADRDRRACARSARSSSSSRTWHGARSRPSSASPRRPGPAELDVLAETDGVGAEVVFEVSGSAPGILAATQHAAIRGRVVVVAIFPEPKPVALFDLFWKELELRGARVYEPEDFERRDRASRRRLPRPRPADHGRRAARARPDVFAELRAGRTAMKILVDCRS